MEPDFRPELIALLEGWLDGSIEVSCKGLGICSNTLAETGLSSVLYAHHFKTWGKYSGDEDFPIPSTNKKYCAVDQFYSTKNLWSGKQGELRRDLLRHLIKCLKAEMDGGNA